MKSSTSLPLFIAPLLAVTLSAQTTGPAPAPDSETEPVMLSVFSVTSQQDRGYRAGNSVSATRIDTPIKNLPFQVSAFTEEFINDIGTRELSDVLKFAPGVTAGANGFTEGNAAVAVRNFISPPQRNGFAGPLYVDGSSIERVEVVKGPASLFYGQIAPGGVVNYITKRPKERAFTQLNTQVGSYDYARVQADINQPLVGDRVLMRFAGAWENELRYVRPFKGEITAFNPSLAAKVTDNSTLTVEYQFYRRREDPQALMRQSLHIPLSNPTYYPNPSNPARGLYSADYWGHYAISDRRYNASNPWDFKHVDVDTVVAEYEIRHNADWTTRLSFNWENSITKFRQSSYGDVLVVVPTSLLSGIANDLKSISLGLDGVDLSDATASYMLRRQQYVDARYQRRTYQAETAGRVDLPFGVWRALVGFQWYFGDTATKVSNLPTALWHAPWDIRDRSTWSDTFHPLSAFSLVGNSLSDFDNKGYYTAHQLAMLDERLLFVGGVRYTEAESSTYNALNSTRSPEFTAHRTTPQIGAGFKVRPDVMLYANYSESFVAGSTTLRTRGVVDRLAEPYLGKGYEGGVKVDLADGRLSGTLGAFQITQENYIFSFNEIDTVSGVTLTSDIQDGNKVESKGVELELTFSPLNHWQVLLNGSIADTTYSEIASPDFQYLVGTQPQYSAKHRLNLWTRYGFDNTALKGLWIGGGFNYTGKKAELSNNPWLFLPAQTVWDAAVGYDWKTGRYRWSAKLLWKNVTDEDEIQTVRDRGQPSRIIADITLRF